MSDVILAPPGAMQTLYDEVNRLAAELERTQRERDDERRHHEELSARYHAVCRKTCESLRDQVSTLTTERDTLRAEVERLRAELEAKGSLAALSAAIERGCIEQIADFVGECMDTEPPGDWRLIPRRIRANAWRKDGAK